MAKQKLMTAAIKKALPALYSNESKPLDEAVVHVRFFNAYGRGEWLITEFDGDDTMFGYCDLGMGGGEFGYVSLFELVGLEAYVFGRKIPGLQAIERDTGFTPKTWGEIQKSASSR